MAKIIIVGGGFAGVKCAKTLRKLLSRDACEIVLFNRENHMVFHPLLAELAGAAIEPKDVAAPLRQVLKNVHCRTEEVLNLDLVNNIVEYEAHDGTRDQMKCDQLVIACGNTVNLGLIRGMDEHAFGLKTVGDAFALQAHIMEQMEKAEVCDDREKRCRYLSFIIVGGGFSGVEVAGEINDLVRRSRRFFTNIDLKDISVTLVHSRDQILPEVSPSLREFAREKMEEAGVKMELNASAAYATHSGIGLKEGRFVSGATVVCTIGSTPLQIIKRLSVPKDRERLVTEADMSLPGHPSVWAIGDCAAITNASDGSICPTVGQFAERQGTQAAHNIVARMNNQPTEPFSYKMMGQLCSIGGKNAVAELLGLRLSGFAAWALWRGVYLMKLPSTVQKIRVGLEWLCDLMFPRTLAHVKADRSRRVSRAYYPAGAYVFQKGNPATDFYVIEQGEVEVLRSHNGDGEGDSSGNGSAEIVAILGPGDFFGEAALMDSRARSTDVRARTDLEVVVLGRNVFTEISASLAPLRDAVAQAVSRRTNIWKKLHQVREVLDTLPLKYLLEPLPEDPIKLDSRLENILDQMNRGRIDFCCVVDDQKCLAGIVTRTDLFRAIEVAAALPEGSELNITARDIMLKDPVAVTIKETAALAMMTMREHGQTTLPVISSYNMREVKGYLRIENIMDCIVKRLIVYEGVEGGQQAAKVTRATRSTMEMDISSMVDRLKEEGTLM